MQLAELIVAVFLLFFFFFFLFVFADVNGIVYDMTHKGSTIIRHLGDTNVKLRCKLPAADYNFYQDSRWTAGSGKRLQITDHGKVVSSLAQNFSISTDGSNSQTLIIKKGILFNFMLGGRSSFWLKVK